MPTPEPYVTKTGRVLNCAAIDAIADEVAGDVDVDALRLRRRARAAMEGGPADVVSAPAASMAIDDPTADSDR